MRRACRLRASHSALLGVGEAFLQGAHTVGVLGSQLHLAGPCTPKTVEFWVWGGPGGNLAAVSLIFHFRNFIPLSLENSLAFKSPLLLYKSPESLSADLLGVGEAFSAVQINENELGSTGEARVRYKSITTVNILSDTFTHLFI